VQRTLQSILSHSSVSESGKPGPGPACRSTMSKLLLTCSKVCVSDGCVNQCILKRMSPSNANLFFFSYILRENRYFSVLRNAWEE